MPDKQLQHLLASFHRRFLCRIPLQLSYLNIIKILWIRSIFSSLELYFEKSFYFFEDCLNLHSESVSPICSLMNRSSASVNSGVSGGTWDEDLFFCWLPINMKKYWIQNSSYFNERCNWIKCRTASKLTHHFFHFAGFLDCLVGRLKAIGKTNVWIDNTINHQKSELH